MNGRNSYIVGGVVVAGVSVLLLPWWVTMILLLVLVAVPVVGYLMLDPTQRRRLNRQRGRRRLGR